MNHKQEMQQIIFGAVVMCLFFAGLIWMIRTNKPPQVDTATPDAQIAVQESYELKGVWEKYAQECYDGTHEKN